MDVKNQDVKTNLSNSVKTHNEKVKLNMEILKEMVDGVFFCAKFNLPFKDRTEVEIPNIYNYEDDDYDSNEDGDSDNNNEDENNEGILRDLLELRKPDIKQQIDSSIVFKDTSGKISNEILQSVVNVYKRKIISEIDHTNYIAVLYDDFHDDWDCILVAIVFRYIFQGKLHERFWGVFKLENHEEDRMSERILSELEIVLKGRNEKLIAQTYGGVSVTKGKLVGIQDKIKEVYPRAHFTHCYAHELNSIVSNACWGTPNARIFFAYIKGIAIFFRQSKSWREILKKHTNGALPKERDIEKSCYELTVSDINQHLESVKECLKEILETNYCSSIVFDANNYFSYLSEENINFWLNFFEIILTHVSVLLSRMQESEIKFGSINDAKATFRVALEKLKSSDLVNKSTSNLQLEAKQLCDNVLTCLEARFEFTSHLLLASLLNKDFHNCSSSVQQKVLQETMDLVQGCYPDLILVKLKEQLETYYKNPSMQKLKNVTELHDYLQNTNRTRTFDALTKLTEILLTNPTTPPDSERESTLDVIKAKFEDTKFDSQSNGLSILSIQKDLIEDKDVGFKDKVIKDFIYATNRRSDFVNNCS